jgi:5-oxoprolinase (ATP-hydrolysing) subunit A
MLLNADLAEGTTPAELTRDLAMLAYLSAINLPCGVHAGEPAQWNPIIDRAIELGIQLGAHPSIGSRADFGRIWTNPDHHLLRDSLNEQLLQLRALVSARGGQLSHLKPHGALYNQAECDPAVAKVIIQVAKNFDPALIMVGLSGGLLIRLAQAEGFAVWHEAFADRAYQANGQLVSRQQPSAVLHDAQAVLRQVGQLSEQYVFACTGERIALRVDTICMHSDTPNTLSSLQLIHHALGLDKK